MKLIEVPAVDFDLAITLNSGQDFHWEKVGIGFCGAIGDRAVYVEQCGNVVRAELEVGALRRRGQQRDEMPRLRTTARTPELVHHDCALDHRLAELCALF